MATRCREAVCLPLFVFHSGQFLRPHRKHKERVSFCVISARRRRCAAGGRETEGAFNEGAFNHLQFLCLFFALGDLLRERRTVNGWIVAASAVVFAIAFHFFTFDETVYMMSRVTTASDHLIGTLLRIAGGVSGIILSFALIELVTGRERWTIEWLARLGTLTLPIYAMHQKFLMLHCDVPICTDGIVAILVETVIVTLLSLAAYSVLSKSRWLALLLFGELRGARSKTSA